MREIVLGVAASGLMTPLWSPRILEEWARAAARLGEADAVIARGEVAALRANWPDAEIAPGPDLQATLYLPDPDDTHVLAAAIVGKADLIATLNLRDFPQRMLTEYGIAAIHPDTLLRDLFDQAPGAVAQAVETVRQTAEHLSGQPQPVRKLLKKARLPRLGKALDQDRLS